MSTCVLLAITVAIDAASYSVGWSCKYVVRMAYVLCIGFHILFVKLVLVVDGVVFWYRDPSFQYAHYLR